MIIKICNCTHISHIVSCYIPPEFCKKKKEPEDKQFCITVYTINNNICDADPQNNLSNKAQLSEHCLI